MNDEKPAEPVVQVPPTRDVRLTFIVDRFFGERSQQVMQLAQVLGRPILGRFGAGGVAEKFLTKALARAGVRAKVKVKLRGDALKVSILPTGDNRFRL